jgi:hypothetical protein
MHSGKDREDIQDSAASASILIWPDKAVVKEIHRRRNALQNL